MSLPRTPPPSPRTKAQGTQPWAESPGEGEQSSRSGPDRPGQWGSLSLFTCHAGRATGSPKAGGAVWPPETTSISEPSRASAP